MNFTELRVLDLSNNLLRELSDGIFIMNGKLQILNLTSNRLVSVSENSFSGLNNLLKLDLSNNQLRTLPGRVLQPLVQSNSAKKSVHATGNIWECDCKLLEFWFWYIDHEDDIHLSGPIICASPSSLFGKILANLSESDVIVCQEASTLFPSNQSGSTIKYLFDISPISSSGSSKENTTTLNSNGHLITTIFLGLTATCSTIIVLVLVAILYRRNFSAVRSNVPSGSANVVPMDDRWHTSSYSFVQQRFCHASSRNDDYEEVLSMNSDIPPCHVLSKTTLKIDETKVFRHQQDGTYTWRIASPKSPSKSSQDDDKIFKSPSLRNTADAGSMTSDSNLTRSVYLEIKE
ncbi:Reticulon-4 receptor-like 2 [Holothuria leucospilota]|uniref:Reticulon-4 receptor-like 2 n=1 Tax=Holothuria leucospilota TaxID=206669 RepID=A0A9Q1C3A6_HOLLE|nr:Reticulon-4 receptor-like 2 [Holothuria leucospilota]